MTEAEMSVGEWLAKMQPPHCDPAVLHAPGECAYCDGKPAWQALRGLWGIAYTGHAPTAEATWQEVPCPSDARRGLAGAHVWRGNAPRPAA